MGSARDWAPVSPAAPALPLRARVAVLATRAVNDVSRRLGAGGGTVAGGRAGLAVDPDLLARLARGHALAFVSGTNGKTTTTRLLAVALEAPGRAVATNASGSNMPAGHVGALVGAVPGVPAVLEVDEGYLPGLVPSLRPEAVVLLNLSRDQLDRTSEVRMVAGRWRRSLDQSATTVVANADDPLVTWAAGAAPRRVWVAAGLSWRVDAVGCPVCDGRIEFALDGTWACACGFARPVPDVWLDGDAVALADGRRVSLVLRLPGRFNRANAAMAMAAAEVLGVPPPLAAERMGGVEEVAGRFAVAEVGGVATRLMLAKNPAGWRELLDLVCPGRSPVVVGINARVADGRDPSWLWDVPFERLAGRPVVATGERCLDLAVRLRYAGLAHLTLRDPVPAVRAAGAAGGVDRRGAGGAPQVEFIGNYTAFHDLLASAGRRR